MVKKNATLAKPNHNLQPGERPEPDKKSNPSQWSAFSRSRYYRVEGLDGTQGESEWVKVLPQIYPEKCMLLWQYTLKHDLSLPFHFTPPEHLRTNTPSIIYKV